MNWISLLGLEVFVARWRSTILEGVIAVEDRLELAHLEWQAQKRRLRRLVVLSVVVAGLTVVALLTLSLAMLVQFWDSPQRTTVAWLLAGGWMALWAVALAVLLKVARQAEHAFFFSRQELAKDWQCIKGQL